MMYIISPLTVRVSVRVQNHLKSSKILQTEDTRPTTIE